MDWGIILVISPDDEILLCSFFFFKDPNRGIRTVSINDKCEIRPDSHMHALTNVTLNELQMTIHKSLPRRLMQAYSPQGYDKMKQAFEKQTG